MTLGDLAYDLVRIVLSGWSLLMAVVLLYQSIPRIRQTAPTPARRLRMGAIVATLLGLIIFGALNTLYTWNYPLPTTPEGAVDTGMIFLAIAGRMFPAVVLTILVFTKPDPSETVPPETPEDWADFREWQKWYKKRHEDQKGQ